MVSDALTLVPVGGTILAKYWNKYGESRQTNPKQDVLNALEQMNRMDENRLESFCRMIEHNTREILSNQEKLNNLVSLQKEILDGIGEIKKDTTKIKTTVEQNQEYLIELRGDVKTIIQQLGIADSVSSDKHIAIPKKILEQLKQKDVEIKRITKELEEMNQKPEIDVDYLLKEGNLYYYNKEYEKAIGFYESVLKKNLKHVDALSNKGAALDELGKHQQAIEWYDKALEIDPKHVYALSNKGLAQRLLKKSE